MCYLPEYWDRYDRNVAGRKNDTNSLVHDNQNQAGPCLSNIFFKRSH